MDLPEDGFALTFPDGWVWVRDSAERYDSVTAQLTEVTSPEFVAEYEVAFMEVSGEMPLVGIAASQGGSCGIAVSPTDLTLDAIASNYVAWIEGQPDISPDGAALTDVALPAIEAKRIDMSHVEAGSQTPTSTSWYLLTSGGRGYAISCSGDDPPDDRWLSIVETWEWLPAEEG